MPALILAALALATCLSVAACCAGAASFGTITADEWAAAIQTKENA